MSGRYRARLSLAYITIFIALGFSLFIPYLVGKAINLLVQFQDGASPTVGDVERSTLITIALILLGASFARGIFDFARTYLNWQPIAWTRRHCRAIGPAERVEAMGCQLRMGHYAALN